MKKHNFSAGPSILPRSVIEKSADGILNINNSSLSLIEISHRSKDFVDIMDNATSLALELLNLQNKGYKALFLQGGASMQFLMTAYNLLENKAGYINTGAWSTKALKEAKNFGNVNVVCSSKESDYNYIPRELEQSPDSIYLHLTSNNTIYGTQWKNFPIPLNKDSYLVADMSSDIFSRPLDISKFGLIYAGAQKNIGPAGVTLVIIRRDILRTIERDIPTMMNYQNHIEKDSMLNTPPVMAIYAVNRSLKWLSDNGGIDSMADTNLKKATKLYNEIERNSLFINTIHIEDRSLMNVPFIFSDKGRDEDFLSFCNNRGLKTLKGHRSVGGFRASIYNAMPEAGIDALVQAMQDYESR